MSRKHRKTWLISGRPYGMVQPLRRIPETSRPFRLRVNCIEPISTWCHVGQSHDDFRAARYAMENRHRNHNGTRPGADANFPRLAVVATAQRRKTPGLYRKARRGSQLLSDPNHSACFPLADCVN